VVLVIVCPLVKSFPVKNVCKHYSCFKKVKKKNQKTFHAVQLKSEVITCQRLEKSAIYQTGICHVCIVLNSPPEVEKDLECLWILQLYL